MKAVLQGGPFNGKEIEIDEIHPHLNVSPTNYVGLIKCSETVSREEYELVVVIGGVAYYRHAASCSACGDVVVPGTDLCSRCLHELTKS